ncbi:hypothetical protein WMY93_006235 [Mugilogobius chulae]|uniref:Uncharacterized protein n=1 Tax=Mugilogobius chulae TaxID=88201 RepID=A0AAW0PJH1_9GOBI
MSGKSLHPPSSASDCVHGGGRYLEANAENLSRAKVDHTTTSPCKNMNKEQTAEGKLSTADSCKPKSGASSGECAEDVRLATSSSTVDSRAGSADPSGLERKDDGAKVIAAGTRMTTRSGAYFSNRYDMNDEDEALLKRMQGEDQEEALHADIKAAVEAETEAVLADFGTEDLTKIVLITIKAAVPAIVKAVQKQLLASNDSSPERTGNILLSRYKEDELEQYKPQGECTNPWNTRGKIWKKTEEILVEKVCKLAAEAGTNIRESDHLSSSSTGRSKKAGIPVRRSSGRARMGGLMCNREREKHTGGPNREQPQCISTKDGINQEFGVYVTVVVRERD